MAVFLTLFLVGVIFLVAHMVLDKQRRLDARVKLLTDDDPGDGTVVYRYLPRDMDDYYRADMNIPTKMYSGIFTGNEDALRIR
ncbi:MAG: hypothetical protein ACO35C_04440 [Pontimonas sp.]